MLLAFFFMLAKSRYSCNKCPLLWQQIFSFSSPLFCFCCAQEKSFSCYIDVELLFLDISCLASPYSTTAVHHPSNLLSILSEKQLFRDKKSHQGKNEIVEAARILVFFEDCPAFILLNLFRADSVLKNNFCKRGFC